MDLSRTPSLRVTLVASLAAVLACVVSGPFGTHVMSLPVRATFWLLLIGWNSAKWWAWYGWVGARADSRRGALLTAGLGALLLNALLPAEIEAVYRLVGMPLTFDWLGLFIPAVLISAAISAVAIVIQTPAPRAPAASPAALPPLAIRAGVASLAAVRLAQAEDHYLRLLLDDGRQPLLLHRFGDALAALAGEDGLQVNRSCWVSATMVKGARRDGRRWTLLLTDGRELPVSASHLTAVRARGWLRR